MPSSDSIPFKAFSKEPFVIVESESFGPLHNFHAMQYEGPQQYKQHDGELIRFISKIKMPSLPRPVERSSCLVLDRGGMPTYYDSEGDGGQFCLERRGQNLLVTMPGGQRLARFAANTDFIYEDFFVLQEWVGIRLSLLNLQAFTVKLQLKSFWVNCLRRVHNIVNIQQNAGIYIIDSSMGPRFFLNKQKQLTHLEIQILGQRTGLICSHKEPSVQF